MAGLLQTSRESVDSAPIGLPVLPAQSGSDAAEVVRGPPRCGLALDMVRQLLEHHCTSLRSSLPPRDFKHIAQSLGCPAVGSHGIRKDPSRWQELRSNEVVVEHIEMVWSEEPLDRAAEFMQALF